MKEVRKVEDLRKEKEAQRNESLRFISDENLF